MFRDERGFTLIHLIAILIVMTAASGVAFQLIEQSMVEGRKIETINQIQEIQRSIYGDTRLRDGTNFGFVEDMGRLPDNLNELLVNPGDPNWDGPYLKAEFLQDYATPFQDAWGNEIVYDNSTGILSVSDESVEEEFIIPEPFEDIEQILYGSIFGNIVDSNGHPPPKGHRRHILVWMEPINSEPWPDIVYDLEKDMAIFHMDFVWANHFINRNSIDYFYDPIDRHRGHWNYLLYRHAWKWRPAHYKYFWRGRWVTEFDGGDDDDDDDDDRWRNYRWGRWGKRDRWGKWDRSDKWSRWGWDFDRYAKYKIDEEHAILNDDTFDDHEYEYFDSDDLFNTTWYNELKNKQKHRWATYGWGYWHGNRIRRTFDPHFRDFWRDYKLQRQYIEDFKKVKVFLHPDRYGRYGYDNIPVKPYLVTCYHDLFEVSIKQYVVIAPDKETIRNFRLPVSWSDPDDDIVTPPEDLQLTVSGSLNIECTKKSMRSYVYEGIYFTNSTDESITIDKILVSWSNPKWSKKIKSIRVGDNRKWSQRWGRKSGELINIPDVELEPGAANIPLRLEWNSNLTGRTLGIVLVLSNGSQLDVTALLTE